MSQLTFGSLFSGIGGFDLGFERAGMKCKWQVEIDDYCNKVLAKHWPNVERWNDVRTFPPREWECSYSWRGAPQGPFGPDVYRETTAERWGVDVICGGDPCQENSAARSSGVCSQPSLGSEFIRIIAALRPRIVVRENPSRVRTDAPWPWWRMRTEMESLGYAVLPFRLRACCLGAKHRRDRLFLLANLPDPNSDGLQGRPCRELGEQAAELPRLLETLHWPDIPTRPGHSSRHGLSGYVGMVKGYGNAVVPQVAEWIGRRIVEAATSSPPVTRTKTHN